jgi:AcrR family transcriptional regulator
MARTVDPAKRLELLDRVVAYLGQYGLAQATLRPMASALGVSTNRLVHHFGPKEDLLAQALDRAIAIALEQQEGWLARKPAMPLDDLYRRWWKWMNADPGNLGVVRLGYEAAAVNASITGLPGAVRAVQLDVWRIDVELRLQHGGMSPATAALEAGLIKAAFSGLVMDLLATGDTRRVSRLFNQWVNRLQEQLERDLVKR